MNDTNRGQRDELEVTGDERKKVLDKIYAQAREWGITIPDVRHYMLHFGLNDFYTTGETEFWIANEIEAGYCAKLLFVFEGQTCPYHQHQVKHETFYILKGKARMVINGEETIKQQGDILAMQTGTKHSFTGEDGPCLLLEVSMPSIFGDSYFDNHNIGNNGNI